ncbi:amidase family protein [Gordonia sp. LSe1-13]|uniref:Amidase family protein n=1 Tax=Gordonia sesuvii TaxID=3116777 RepID=A0ABU7MAP4_9ACTN|nr:amidase family protein [Gordonia sp. LSe1-13]
MTRDISRRGFFGVAGVSVAGALGFAATGPTSAAPRPGNVSPAVDPTVWREYGNPLVPASGHGLLEGRTVAVKDLFSISGHRVGAGNEEWLRQSRPATTTAPSVAALLAAGASIAGISRTDEFAYSLAGTNGHYGTPPNPKAPDRIPGGSSSGSASAVSLSQAAIGLGTDTGGSIRIPSSYQGLYGIRTTHGAISRDGLIPLAPSFDTVGWMTRSRADLVATTAVLAPGLPSTIDVPLVYAEEIIDLASPDVAESVRAGIKRLESRMPVRPLAFDTAVLPTWVKAFQTRQGWEAWRAHGDWISRHWDSLNPDVRSRFETASEVTRSDLAAADSVLATARNRINTALGDSILLLPSASSTAPTRADAALGGPVIEETRASTFQLTCLAGITGRPAVSNPLPVAGPPVGLCAVGPRGSDLALAALPVV